MQQSRGLRQLFCEAVDQALLLEDTRGRGVVALQGDLGSCGWGDRYGEPAVKDVLIGHPTMRTIQLYKVIIGHSTIRIIQLNKVLIGHCTRRRMQLYKVLICHCTTRTIQLHKVLIGHCTRRTI